MSNGNNNTSQGGSPSQGGGYHANAWPFASVGFNTAAVGTSASATDAGADGYGSMSGTGGVSSDRPLLSGRSGSAFPVAHSARRYGARTANPYETSLAARRRQMNGPVPSSSRDRRAQGAGQGQGGDPERKRVVVACLRCRKRKIRCSGDDGTGGACTNCKNASEQQCLFMRVQAGSLAEMRKKEQDKRFAASAVVNNFSYDMNACRQYQSRGAASVGTGMSAHSTAYGAPSTFAAPGNVMYNWTPGGATGGYNDSNGHGVSGTSNAGVSIGYGLPYHGMPYHGIPSPDTSYMGENDLMERPTASSMADAGGAFALQSMSAGLPTVRGSSYGQGHSHNHNHSHGNMATSTPRSLPGPPTVLGSSRGVPQSSIFSASRAPQQYPSPATTPITGGVSPAWSGYEQSPYGPAAMPASVATQPLDRLPDLYSATPPPPPRSSSGSQRGDDEVLDISNNSGSHDPSQQQQQQQHFGYDYGDSRGQSVSDGEEHPGGVDMVNNHTSAPGGY